MMLAAKKVPARERPASNRYTRPPLGRGLERAGNTASVRRQCRREVTVCKALDKMGTDTAFLSFASDTEFEETHSRGPFKSSKIEIYEVDRHLLEIVTAGAGEVFFFCHSSQTSFTNGAVLNRRFIFGILKVTYLELKNLS